VNIYIQKDNQHHGPYTADQVRSWISSGNLRKTDFACYEGASDWVPLHTLPGIGLQPTQYVSGGSGWGFIIAGMICFLFGMLLSLTLIGAIIGIPLAIGGAGLAIYGRVRHQQWVMQKLTESVRVGMVQGMQAPAPTVFRSYVQEQDSGHLLSPGTFEEH
jgi:hypothetical protein